MITDASGEIKRAAIQTSTENTTIVAAVSGKRIRVLALYLNGDGDFDCRFESGTGGTALTGVIPTGAGGNSDLTLPFNPAGWFQTAAGELLNMEQDDTPATVAGVVVYQEVD